MVKNLDITECTMYVYSNLLYIKKCINMHCWRFLDNFIKCKNCHLSTTDNIDFKTHPPHLTFI